MLDIRADPPEILVVEDNHIDVLMIRHALNETKVLTNLHVVEDGQEAMDFLHKRGKYTEAPRPNLIFLDLNLPKKSGREVLAEIKQDPRLLNIPVLILTTSSAEQDITLCYELHGNCFITKPIDIDQFTNVMKSIEKFWLNTVTLPTNKDTVRINQG